MVNFLARFGVISADPQSPESLLLHWESSTDVFREVRKILDISEFRFCEFWSEMRKILVVFVFRLFGRKTSDLSTRQEG